MNARTNVTLMTPDPTVAAAVASALQSNGHVLIGPAVRDVRELPAQLGRSPVPIVLIDLDPQPQQVLPHLERMVARFPATRFVALSSTVGNDLLLEAMQTGVRRVMVKQTLATELRGVLDRLTAADSSAADTSGGGEVITVLSASGGCGATTLAVNLAEELSLKQNQPTLLCDLDCAYGAVASYLGLSPRYAVDHVLNYSGQVDPNLIRSTATVHGDRIHVLASPCSTDFAHVETLNFGHLEQVLDAARRAYGVTVVDAPRIPLDAVATLASASSFTLLVLQLTVKDLRTARAMVDALRERGVDADSIVPVANRYVKRQLISLDEASKALGGMDMLVIRNDYAPAIHGLNFGQPLSQAGPRSSLRRDLQDLLTRLDAKKRVSA
jgi:pilus assembly protein CpaE